MALSGQGIATVVVVKFWHLGMGYDDYLIYLNDHVTMIDEGLENITQIDPIMHRIHLIILKQRFKFLEYYSLFLEKMCN